MQRRLGIGAKELVGFRSRAALRWHVDSNTHGDRGRGANGFTFGGKCRAAAGARRAYRSEARPYGGRFPRRLHAG